MESSSELDPSRSIGASSDDSGRTSGIDIPSLTESSGGDENQDSELESFRQQWKQELKTGPRLQQLGAAGNTKKTNKNWRTGGNRNLNRHVHATPTASNVGNNNAPVEDNSRFGEASSRSASTNNKSIAVANTKVVIQQLQNVVLTDVSSPIVEASRNDCVNDNYNYNNCSGNTGRSRMSDEEKEQLARQHYIRGVELERAGQLYEAIQQYRRAMQLVPDIENTALLSCLNNDDNSDNEDDTSQLSENNSSSGTGLFGQLTSLLSPSAPVCQPRYQQQALHVSSLPQELLENILCWVVGGELDVRSLHAFSAVCRGFYVLTRAETLWKKACQRVWGRNCSLEDRVPPSSNKPAQKDTEKSLYGDSWRLMYLTRPQPRYNGCYISKTSYFRSGECNFHDHTYQPWHLVSYYRCIRFFPGGVSLMLTTSELPQTVVGHLSNRDPKQPQVLVGQYSLEGSLINLKFRREHNNKRGSTHRSKGGKRWGQGTTDVAETLLSMTLELLSTKKGIRNWFLCWRSYSITSVLQNGLVESNDLDVSQLDSFPQLAFSRVKSYNRESMQQLQ